MNPMDLMGIKENKGKFVTLMSVLKSLMILQKKYSSNKNFFK